MVAAGRKNRVAARRRVSGIETTGGGEIQIRVLV